MFAKYTHFRYYGSKMKKDETRAMHRSLGDEPSEDKSTSETSGSLMERSVQPNPGVE